MDGSAASVGRIMAPLLGAPGPPRATSRGSASRSSSRTSSATSARTGGLDRLYLPTEDRERFGVGEADLARPPRPRVPRAGRVRGAPCAVPVRRGRRRRVAAVPLGRSAGMRAGARGLPRACSIASRRSASTSSAAHRSVAVGCCRASRSAGVLRRPRDAPGDHARGRAHLAGRRAGRRPDLRRELRGPRRRARARRARAPTCSSSTATRSASAPTSACAAPTPWLHAHGRRRADPPGDPVHDASHAARLVPLPAALELVVVRLPHAVPSCSSPSATPASRPPRSSGRDGDGVHTDRGDLRRAARRRRARLAPRAGRRAAYQPPEAPLSRGLEVHPDGGGEDLDVWIDRSLVRSRLRLERAGGRRAARRRRAPTSRATTCRTPTERPGRPARRATPCATRATGSRTACARPSRTACSSPATAPGTASRCRARGSAPRSTSGSRAGRELRARARRASAPRRGARAATRAFSARHRRAFGLALRAPAAGPGAAAAGRSPRSC